MWKIIRSPYYKKKENPTDLRNFGESISNKDESKFVESVISVFKVLLKRSILGRDVKEVKK